MFKKLVFLIALMTGLQAFSISIDQPSIFLETRSGSRESFEINVQNPNSYPIKLKIYAADWEYNDKGGKRFLEAGSSEHGLSKWLQMPDQKELVLSAFEEKKIKFRIETPKDAEGGHVGVIFFESDTGINKGGLSYAARIGSIIYQQTRDKTRQQMQIDEAVYLKSSRNGILQLAVSNLGNGYDFLQGTISLLDEREQPLNNKEFKLELLPGTGKKVAIDLPLLDSKKLLLTAEDSSGALQSKLIYLKGSKADRSTQKALDKAADNINTDLKNNELLISKFNAVYNEPKLKLFLKAAAGQKQNIQVQAKIFTKNDQRVKTFSLGKRLLDAGKITAYSGDWDAGKHLNNGEYTLKIEFLNEKEQLLYTQKIGRIIKSTKKMTLEIPDINNRKLTL